MKHTFEVRGTFRRVIGTPRQSFPLQARSLSGAPRLARLVGLSMVAASLAVAATASPAQASIVTDRCGFTTVIGVRGSSEPAGSGSTNEGRTYASGGLGGPISSLVVSMSADPEFPVYVEALAYPAVVAEDSLVYFGSLNLGTRALQSELEDLARTCPNTNVVLAGYSQGAAVISQTLSGSLSPSAKSHLSAVVLFGDPGFHAGQAWNAAGSGTANGIFGSNGAALEGYTKLAWEAPSYGSQTQQTIIRSYCYSGDMFCQGNLTADGAMIHSSYGTHGDTMTDAYIFTKNWLTDFN